MHRKVRRIIVLLAAVFIGCLAFSPAALAKECPPAKFYSCTLSVNSCQPVNSSNCTLSVNSCRPAVSNSTNSGCLQLNTPQPATVWQQPSCSQSAGTCPQPAQTAPAQTAKPAATTPAKTTAPAPATTSMAAYAAEVVRLVNVERAANGLAPLTMDTKLSAAALIRAGEANTKFSHTRPNGKSCFTVLAEQGISYRGAGENIAIGQSSPAQVVKAWMDSPGHRANILGSYTKIGVGVTQASGNFRGYSWAQFFTR